jgi:hypothetical protein
MHVFMRAHACMQSRATQSGIKLWVILCTSPVSGIIIMSHISLLMGIIILNQYLYKVHNYPTTQPPTWPFLTALVELRQLEETATN